jgi:hypothetical protein
MGHLILQGDNTIYPGFSLLGESSLGITLDETGSGFDINELKFLVLSGTTSVSIASTGAPGSGHNFLDQLEEANNNLTTVTISGFEKFVLGNPTGLANSGDGVVTDIDAGAVAPITIHSSLKLIDASAATSQLQIDAGATNTSVSGNFQNGGSLNNNVTITYTGLTIKGNSSPDDFIENDAKNGIVTVGNGTFDNVFLGGAHAKATLGTGPGDRVDVGSSGLGTNETAGSALGDTVKLGAAATAHLTVGTGAEAGSTAGITSIGLTKVLNAADGMEIDFTAITSNSSIADATNVPAVASATSVTAAENAAVKAFFGPIVVYFSFHGNEYFIATNNVVETTVSSHDAIVELVGITNIHHATNSLGSVTLHV